MINVTKTFLPPLAEYNKYLEGIWERGYVTNRGPLVLELEEKLKAYLGVKHLLFLSNGTVALQLAIKALNLQGEILTTPFSYVATTTAILWENCKPVFVDIEPETYCIDPTKIEAAITDKTSAILATHVYGYPCQVEKIEAIAQKYNLKVIYDGAHAFGVKVNGNSVFNYGDVSTLSFHATKLFHTIEGGAVITDNDEVARQMMLYHQFGHVYDDYFTIGINGKNSELHAAMGLCTLPKVNDFIQRRSEICAFYDVKLLPLGLERPVLKPEVEYNYAYYPIIFSSEAVLLQVKEALAKDEINTRRYFYPSLNKLPYVAQATCTVSEDIAARVLCLPLFYELKDQDLERITTIIEKTVNGLSD
jgi:dTDP-4-amino-4,6-dideoxygalactose transaminase